MKIALVFGDNDFWKTQFNLMKLLNDAFQWNGNLKNLTKEEICFIINELSLGFYIIFQSRDITELIYSEIELNNTRDYLKVYPKDILFNDEVDEYLETHSQCGNSDTNIIDTDTYTNGIKTGYVWTF